jgi:hypothetical protein
VSETLVPFLIVAVPACSYLFGVWVASEAERRAFSRAVRLFDDDTRDHRRKTPRVRMTLYNRFVERTRRTQKIFAPPVSEKDALLRRFVFLSLKPPPEKHDTVRDLEPPFEEPDDQVTLRMRR